MYCKKCGTKLNERSKFCPKCGINVAEENPKTEPVYQTSAQPKVLPDVKEQEVVTGELLTGKEYTFISTVHTNLFSLLEGRIISNVEIAEDRLFIDISPKRYNKYPAILFEDITGIDISRNINLSYWSLIIIAVICGFALSPYYFLPVVLLVWAGLQRKITISQRNGKKVVMYDRSGSQAMEFKEDMKKVVRIR